MSEELSTAGRKLRVIAKANSFSAFYRDLQAAFKTMWNSGCVSVSVQRTGNYSRCHDGRLVFVQTLPALKPGQGRLSVRLK